LHRDYPQIVGLKKCFHGAPDPSVCFFCSWRDHFIYDGPFNRLDPSNGKPNYIYGRRTNKRLIPRPFSDDVREIERCWERPLRGTSDPQMLAPGTSWGGQENFGACCPQLTNLDDRHHLTEIDFLKHRLGWRNGCADKPGWTEWLTGIFHPGIILSEKPTINENEIKAPDRKVILRILELKRRWIQDCETCLADDRLLRDFWLTVPGLSRPSPSGWPNETPDGPKFFKDPPEGWDWKRGPFRRSCTDSGRPMVVFDPARSCWRAGWPDWMTPKGFLRLRKGESELAWDGKPHSLPNGWKNCCYCLFYFKTGMSLAPTATMKGPGSFPHREHRHGLSPWMTEFDLSPGDKIHSSTIPRCPHQWYNPVPDLPTCTVCRDIIAQEAAKTNEGWECFYGGLPRSDIRLTEKEALKCLQGDRPSGVIDRFTLHDLKHAQRVFRCGDGRTLNWKTAREVLADPPPTTEPKQKEPSPELAGEWKGILGLYNLAWDQLRQRSKEESDKLGIEEVRPDQALQTDPRDQGEPELPEWPEREDVQIALSQSLQSFSGYCAAMRRTMDGDEVTRGYQMRATPRPERPTEPPEWVMDSVKFAQYAKHLLANDRGRPGRVSAARVVAMLYWYHRYGLTAAEIGAQLGLKSKVVKDRLAHEKKMAKAFFAAFSREFAYPETTYEGNKS